MNCEHVHGNLFDYLDGSLSAADLSALEEHLAGCPDCRAAVRQESQLAQSFSRRLEQTVENVVLDPFAKRHLARAVEQAVAAESRERPAVVFWRRLLWPLGAAAVMLLMAFGMEHHFGAHLRRQVARDPVPPAGHEVLVHVSNSRPGYLFRKEGNQVVDALTSDTLVVEATLRVPNL